MLKTFPLTRLVTAVCLAGSLSACPFGGGEDGKKDDAGSARSDAGGNTAKDAGVASDAGKADAGKDAGSKDGGHVATKGSKPVLESVEARQSGRFGGDLRIDVTGNDIDGDAVALSIKVFAKGGSPVNLGDSDHDGKTDPGPLDVPLMMALGMDEGSTSFIVLRDLFNVNNGLDHVEVTLVDATELSSETMSADIAKQAVLNNGDVCDATYVDNRCADGFGCKGTVPTVCSAGEAPKITRGVYYVDDLGTRVLVEGTDPDLDVKSYVIEFLSSAGAPVMIDTDGDTNNVPDANKFEGEARLVWDGTKFFMRLDQGETFADLVPQVRIKMIDRGGLISATVMATKGPAPTRSSGQVCDVRTFDRCASNTVCYSSNMGKNYSCTPTSTARSKSCTAALTLAPVEGTDSVRGTIASPSLWEPPAGCAPGVDNSDQPEAVVKLVLTENAKKVTLSTNNLYTSFDTTLYMMSKCEGPAVLAWCSDYAGDGEMSGAELVITDVTAGTYYIGVDSFNSSLSGTTFQLDVTVE